MTPATKKLILLFGGLAFFTALLVIGANIFLKRIAPEPVPANLPASGRERSVLPPPERGPSYRIKQGPEDDRPISYTQSGFAPTRMTIRSSDPMGCVISVINKSVAPIRIGVNPHDPAGDPGANYGTITPGHTGLLDPRYLGRGDITLHNHSNPAHEFTVVYGEGCK